jgi:hypothetical protein
MKIASEFFCDCWHVGAPIATEFMILLMINQYIGGKTGFPFPAIAIGAPLHM